MTQWFEEAFGPDYLILYPHRNSADAATAVSYLQRFHKIRPPQTILDLGCGAGRHSQLLAENSFEITGVDLSFPLLKEAVSKSAAETLAHLRLVQARMERLPVREGAFDFVINLFTSFGYFETDDENLQVLREVSRVLKPGGHLILDYFNTIWLEKNLRLRNERRLPDGSRVQEQRWIDKEAGRVNKRLKLHTKGEVKEYVESVRLYRQEDFSPMLSKVGLVQGGTHGDLEGRPFRPTDSPRLIIWAQKPR